MQPVPKSTFMLPSSVVLTTGLIASARSNTDQGGLINGVSARIKMIATVVFVTPVAIVLNLVGFVLKPLQLRGEESATHFANVYKLAVGALLLVTIGLIPGSAGMTLKMYQAMDFPVAPAPRKDGDEVPPPPPLAKPPEAQAPILDEDDEEAPPPPPPLPQSNAALAPPIAPAPPPLTTFAKPPVPSGARGLLFGQINKGVQLRKVQMPVENKPDLAKKSASGGGSLAAAAASGAVASAAVVAPGTQDKGAANNLAAAAAAALTARQSGAPKPAHKQLSNEELAKRSSPEAQAKRAQEAKEKREAREAKEAAAAAAAAQPAAK